MTTATDDAAKLLTFIDEQRIAVETSSGAPAWNHMGAVLADAAIQPLRLYRSWVKPRVVALRNDWPDAATTEGLQARLATDDVAAALKNLDSPRRTAKIPALAQVMADHNIDTVAELRTQLADPDTRTPLRRDIRKVRDVGPKTVDYFDRLAGLPEGVAIDSRLRAVAAAAGIENTGYDHLAAVIRAAAKQRGWAPADLDAALWRYGQPAFDK
ncbi:hypothetical protein GCM10025865_33880 (plasmid) [Paraoerskovia sediminicola]|uniref:Uncharacterized protein n=1 Tax=Paraoerskovia sediminicola TaxID=1138587 RepID=A0ABM8G7E9_9CELL|nr:hypothetical protein [Paraoerskovia sediminicola]BDZ44044.1 hypothetical protein GCM10025865_33430 [Paraoerskovia sediminicola]BDZ44089.1 hypothetical protein GCM10025865_33880 [Paraoerskovia sediminicola]